MKGKEIFVIRGGNPLYGKVVVHGAKNAVLPMLAASVLTADKVSICDCPLISDVDDMVRVLETLGVTVERKGREINLVRILLSRFIIL